MKLFARVFAALGMVLASLFVASPALANEPHTGASQYSTAGGPHDIVAISIVMVVLLVVVLATATLIGNLFQEKE